MRKAVQRRQQHARATALLGTDVHSLAREAFAQARHRNNFFLAAAGLDQYYSISSAEIFVYACFVGIKQTAFAAQAEKRPGDGRAPIAPIAEALRRTLRMGQHLQVRRLGAGSGLLSLPSLIFQCDARGRPEWHDLRGACPFR